MGRPAGKPYGQRSFTPGAGAGGPGGFKRRPMMKKRLCRLCQEKVRYVDWKAVNTLRTFITERGKILSARSTGTCSKCQRQLMRAIKRARNMALLPTSPI
jgi:small subunit ribosomal protein S18